MSSFVVEGGHKLRGEITPQGAKNEALQIISAVLLTKDEVTISNIPEILDVKNLILLLEGMGVKVTRRQKGVYTFKADEIDTDYIMSMDQTELQWCTVDEYKKKLTGIATDYSNGLNNLRSIMKIAGWKDKYPAFAWCADHGDGWYLPAIDELKELLLNDEVHAKVNGTLEQKRVSVMCSKGVYKWYWSSTEYDEWCAWFVHMSVGDTGNYSRSLNGGYVRAVSAF